MERWHDRIAVVTGASVGIGAAIVKDLVKAGLIVVGLARRQELVTKLRTQLPANLQSRLHSVQCDVSNVQSVNQAFDWIEKKLGAVDILVNNAGILSHGQLLTHDLEKMEQIIRTNVMGVVYCTRRAFKSMQARNFAGHVIVINSIAGHGVVGIPGTMPIMNIYPPSKFAVTAIVEVLRQEFREFQTKIKITSISPGAVDTDILPDDLRSDCILKSEDVSDAVLYAIRTPPTVQIYELTIKPLGEVV